MISESEYLAPVLLEEEGKIALQLIYSNVDQIVEQHQYMFEVRQHRLNRELERLRGVYDLLALESWKIRIKLSTK